jgi:hypothetical protein
MRAWVYPTLLQLPQLPLFYCTTSQREHGHILLACHRSEACSSCSSFTAEVGLPLLWLHKNTVIVWPTCRRGTAINASTGVHEDRMPVTDRRRFHTACSAQSRKLCAHHGGLTYWHAHLAHGRS